MLPRKGADAPLLGVAMGLFKDEEGRRGLAGEVEDLDGAIRILEPEEAVALVFQAVDR